MTTNSIEDKSKPKQGPDWMISWQHDYGWLNFIYFCYCVFPMLSKKPATHFGSLWEVQPYPRHTNRHLHWSASFQSCSESFLKNRSGNPQTNRRTDTRMNREVKRAIKQKRGREKEWKLIQRLIKASVINTHLLFHVNGEQRNKW